MLRVPTIKAHLVVVAPHPDDEVLGCAGSILQALERGECVTVIYLTRGDANRVGVMLDNRTPFPKPKQYTAYGIMREREANRALDVLGVHPEKRLFLGLPDMGLQALASPTFQGRYRSPFTKAPSTRQAALQTLKEALSAGSPAHILVPLPVDSHSDHRAAARLVREVLCGLEIEARLSAYPVHSPHWPKPSGSDPSLPLDPPRYRQQEWQCIPLTEGQRLLKQQALGQYASQFRVPLLGKLMRSLVRSNELLLPLGS